MPVQRLYIFLQDFCPAVVYIKQKIVRCPFTISMSRCYVQVTSPSQKYSRHFHRRLVCSIGFKQPNYFMWNGRICSLTMSALYWYCWFFAPVLRGQWSVFSVGQTWMTIAKDLSTKNIFGIVSHQTQLHPVLTIRQVQSRELEMLMTFFAEKFLNTVCFKYSYACGEMLQNVQLIEIYEKVCYICKGTSLLDKYICTSLEYLRKSSLLSSETRDWGTLLSPTYFIEILLVLKA